MPISEFDVLLCVQWKFDKECIMFKKKSLKGSLKRDFRLQVIFMNQCPPGPQVFHWGHFEFFQKFTEIFANEYLSPVSLIPAINP